MEAYDFHYGEIARLTAATIDEAKNKFDHIEINSPEDDLAIRIIVRGNSVDFTIPYWYKGDDAVRLFDHLRAYIKIIRETAGYFVFYPQSGHAFDPAEKDLEGLRSYLSISDDLSRFK